VPAKHTADSAADPTAPPGYSPAQLTAYLGLTGDGAGQTIAIVDAYDDPDIVSDAETYSQQFGQPGVCGAGGTAGDCFTLDVKQQSASAGSNADWGLETSLDVEGAHALAPRATIELVEASEGTFASLFRAVSTAVASHPAAVSMSWGINEEFAEETYYDHFCAVTSTVCVVSSGDYGNPGEYPAYNPSVLSVGGTTLNLASDGSVTSELAWSGSGGGQSWVEPEPAYQSAVQDSGQREMPDVSFDADPNTGVAVYDSVPYGGQSGRWEVGGTSVGAPSWSAILADADQLRAADGKAPLTADGDAVQQAIYSLPSSLIAPVTTGPANGFCPVGCTPTAGYDEITGLGSPRAGIDAALAAQNGMS
jgi:subtilase family serine protease